MGELGAEVWVVAPDDPAKLEAMKEDLGLEYPVLVDTDCTVAKAFGILNEEMPTVPHPTALVIDKDGVVRYVRVDVDYKVRPPAEELIAALKELG